MQVGVYVRCNNGGEVIEQTGIVKIVSAEACELREIKIEKKEMISSGIEIPGESVKIRFVMETGSMKEG